jgi:chromosomal replication initiation ATPase DnaA
MINEFEILDFFREVQRVIAKHGLQKVLGQLRRIQIDCGNSFEKDVSDFILVTTANHYSLDKQDVLISKKRGVISEARRMCFALMKEHLPFTDEEIGDYFGGRSRQYVNNELTKLPINHEKLATKQENKFVNDFIILTTIVLKYKNGYNLNNKIDK